MIKKLWLLLLSLVVILFVWTTFANPIAPETYFVCSMFENVEIDNYRVIVQNGSSFYEPTVESCSQCWERPVNEDGDAGRRYYGSLNGPSQQVFLLDKSVSIEDISENNVESRAISIWSVISTYCDRWANRTKRYQVVSSWNTYTLLDKTEQYKIKQEQLRIKQEVRDSVKDFPLYWSLTVIIETLVLLFLSKLFRKENQISNKKLLLRWMIPTTITLPLLWFALPLVIWSWTWYVIIWEFLVMIVEAIMIKYWLSISRIKALVASFLCNMFSFIVLPSSWDIDRALKTVVTWLFIIILFEVIIIFLIWKFLRKKNYIPNKRLITAWIVSPVVSVLMAILSVRLVLWIYEEVIGYGWSDWLAYITFWVMQILTWAIIIKWLRKISRKRAIITSIISSIPLIFVLD